MKTVLIVDDRSDLVSTLAGQLSRFGDDVDLLTAPDGQEAVSLLESRQIDALVAAAQHPEINELDLVCRALAARPSLNVILLSGDHEPIAPDVDRKGLIRFAVPPADSGEADWPAMLREEPGAASPGGGWNGSLDIVDLVRIVRSSGKTRTIRLVCDEGIGLLGFEDGRLVHASTGGLRGADAFFQMVLWGPGSFEEVAARPGDDSAPNIDLPPERLEREASLFRAALGADELVERIDDIEPIDDADTRARWWSPILGAGSRAARVLIGVPPETDVPRLQSVVTALAAAVEAERQWSTLSGDGPSFIRLYPRGGGLISITLLPLAPRHQVLFESFAGDAIAVVLCGNGTSCDLEDWLDRIPEEVPGLLVAAARQPDLGVRDALVRLAAEQP